MATFYQKPANGPYAGPTGNPVMKAKRTSGPSANAVMNLRHTRDLKKEREARDLAWSKDERSTLIQAEMWWLK